MNNSIMKTLVLMLAVTITACNAPAEKEAAKEQEGAGFFTPVEGETYVVATDAVTDVWMNYIKAHNDGDIEAIMSMESDSISIETEDGNVMKGKDMHREGLSAWFEAESPQWNVYWAMPYKAVNGGQEWIIAGHEVTTTVDGKQNVELHMIDGQIEDGKIKQFYVYSKDVPVPPKMEADTEE